MSHTTAGVDARAYLAGWVDAVSGMTIADIHAIPDDKWTEPRGGCTRSNPHLVADMVCNLQWTTAVLRGEESDSYNHMEALADQFADKSAAAGALATAAKDFSAAIREASDERLNSKVMAPWQMEAPVMILAHIAASHIWYHDGQLNYVQCLLGDDQVHWMV